MIKRLSLAVLCSAFLALATAAQAADQNGDQFITAQKSTQVLASSIIGMSIKNSARQDAEEIGTVNDLIMNKDHKLVGVVVGIGGFLGLGQKSVGIPWNEVKNMDPQKGVAVVNVTKKQLQDAPEFKSKQTQQQEQQRQQQQQQAPTGTGGGMPGGTPPGGGAPAPGSGAPGGG